PRPDAAGRRAARRRGSRDQHARRLPRPRAGRRDPAALTGRPHRSPPHPPPPPHLRHPPCLTWQATPVHRPPPSAQPPRLRPPLPSPGGPTDLRLTLPPRPTSVTHPA